MGPEERIRAGRAVEATMAARALSGAAVARAANVDPKTIRSLVHGTTWPTSEHRARIEIALGWQIGDLLRVAMGERAGPVGSDVEQMSDGALVAEIQRMAAELQRRAQRRESRVDGAGTKGPEA